jgi:hypothetical protein
MARSGEEEHRCEIADHHHDAGNIAEETTRSTHWRWQSAHLSLGGEVDAQRQVRGLAADTVFAAGPLTPDPSSK